MNFGNIVSIDGKPPKHRLIKDMEIGEEGYIVEWAIINDKIKIDFTVSPIKMGTYNVRIKCVGNNNYKVFYEN